MNSRILAIDFGTVRHGVAVSDPSRTIASPLAVVPAGTAAIEKILALARDEGATEILVGLPVTVAGGDSDMTRRVRAFGKALQAATPLAVILYDERYSSQIAQDIMIESGKSRRKRREKGAIDKVAAAAMLQEYLNARGSRDPR